MAGITKGLLKIVSRANEIPGFTGTFKLMPSHQKRYLTFPGKVRVLFHSLLI